MPWRPPVTTNTLPTNTVTFLFTDIEGSTSRWEHFPHAMKAALSRHDALLRHAIEAHGGHVFKTVGDAFCAAFPSPYDALQAALATQRSLHSEDWSAFFAPQAGTGTDHSLLSPQSSLLIRVRMALHTGAVEEQGGDYFGQPLNRVARLLS